MEWLQQGSRELFGTIIEDQVCDKHGNIFSRGFVKYRRIPKVTAPITFGFSRPKGPLLSGG